MSVGCEEHRAGAEEFQHIVGRSVAATALRDRIARVAPLDRTALVLGPTGSGKELVARSLHALSLRRGEPFVTIHCGAIPENLMEAELFGHSRGAFTGATEPRVGLVRSAKAGTLFLDEIDSLPLVSQARLLRFLEAGEFRAVGSDRTEHSPARVVVATNRDLAECARGGTFRTDLLYRLDVVRVEVPPLRDRDDDVLLLAQHFLDRMGAPVRRFSRPAIAALRGHDWPGNVRELRHRVESAALLSRSDELDAAELGFQGASRDSHSTPAPADASLETTLWSLVKERAMTLDEVMSLCERSLIESALTAEGNHRARAADRLGIHVRTLYKKL